MVLTKGLFIEGNVDIVRLHNKHAEIEAIAGLNKSFLSAEKPYLVSDHYPVPLFPSFAYLI